MVNATGVWKLVTFDLESYFRTHLSYNFRMARLSNFVFDMEICLENIYVLIQLQGHRAKVKVTAAKNGRMQMCVFLRHS